MAAKMNSRLTFRTKIPYSPYSMDSADTQQLEWVKATNNGIPPHGIAQGVEKNGHSLYIARAFFQEGLHPGKAAPHLANGGFALGWGGKSYGLSEYYVLCGNVNRTRWVSVEGAVPHDNLKYVVAGHEKGGEPLYVAKGVYQDTVQLGKAGHHLPGGMSFAFGDREVGLRSYMVLVHV
ncbi:hypothetical protein GGI07_001349 [Coemansia sp. Benny D115]|nr:hypothetical protein GGI07_001349 [Coemansia sp. Benny D115]